MGLQCQYPSGLNASASKFGPCGQAHHCADATTENWKRCEQGSSSEESKTGETWITGLDGDIILSRFSSLLFEAESSCCTTNPMEKGMSMKSISGDIAVILPQILPQKPNLVPICEDETNRSKSDTSAARNASHFNPVGEFLQRVGIEEVEALNPKEGGPTAGQCQFASVAAALCDLLGTDSVLRKGYRPDLELRKLAMHVIEMNSQMYRDFLTVPSSRTRSQFKNGGQAVNMDNYIRNMSSPSCDGDAVTLQALCDALKITVRVVKPVNASVYDHLGQRQRLMDQSSSSAAFISSAPSEVSDDCDVSVGELSLSSRTSNESDVSASIGTSCQSPSLTTDDQERLSISQEIRPRRLQHVDSRVRDVQNLVKGRLIWLSHIGDEVHYRFLRSTTHNPSVEEVNAAVASRKERCCAIDESCTEDGYIRHFFSEGLDFDDMKGSYAKYIEDCKDNPSIRPRCGLCMSDMLGVEKRRLVSSSTCVHDFCEQCLSIWTAYGTKKCPTCDNSCEDVVESLNGKPIQYPEDTNQSNTKYWRELSYWAWKEFESFNASRGESEFLSQEQILKIAEMNTMEMLQLLRDFMSTEEAAANDAEDIEVISVVLTPRDHQSSLYSNEISIDHPESSKAMYIVDDEVYLEALKALHVFNDRKDSVLPFTTVGFSKLLIWTISCEYIRQYHNYASMLDIIVALMQDWSKTCGLSSHTAFNKYVSLQKATIESPKAVKAPPKPSRQSTRKKQCRLEKTSKKAKSNTQVTTKRAQNKRKSARTTTTQAHTNTRCKLRKITSTQDDLEKILNHKRAKGKRRVRAPEKFANIPEEHWY